MSVCYDKLTHAQYIPLDHTLMHTWTHKHTQNTHTLVI